MVKKKFKVSASVNIPCKLAIKDPSLETHGLLRLSNGLSCDFLNLTFIGKGKDITEKIEARTFLQLDLADLTSIILDAEFLDETGFIEGEFYTGTWEEIILREIELSLSDTPFFYSCDLETLKLSVGVTGQSQLEVNSDTDGNFAVIFTVKNSSGQTDVVKRNFAESSHAAGIINRLYGRLKELTREDDFEERQLTDKEKLAEQFNKTMSESFRFSK